LGIIFLHAGFKQYFLGVFKARSLLEVIAAHDCEQNTLPLWEISFSSLLKVFVQEGFEQEKVFCLIRPSFKHLREQ